VGGVFGWGLVVCRVFIMWMLEVSMGATKVEVVSCNGSAEMVGVCCALGGTVLAN
jgi:hypothetical protein